MSYPKENILTAFHLGQQLAHYQTILAEHYPILPFTIWQKHKLSFSSLFNIKCNDFNPVI
jgi:hypothetical protein